MFSFHQNLNSEKIKRLNPSRILKNHFALSTVVTTLIILVISVMLAGTVAYYAINVTGTRSQEENLHLSKPHIWYNAASVSSQGALLIINTGGRDVVIDKITVRGEECVLSSIFFNRTTNSVSSDLAFVPSLTDGISITIGFTSAYIFEQASHGLTLQSGQLMMVYINNPPGININNVGLITSITVYTTQATYYAETNVQALEA